MKTIRIKIYKFNELNEQAQTKAIEQMSDINVGYNWWDYMYQDAQNVGIKITDFDLERGNIGGKLTMSLTDSCELIITNYGEDCETHKTARAYLAEWAKLVREHSDGIDIDKVCEDKEYEFDELADELETQFKLSILEDYRILLQQEYTYQTSEESIKETIIANDYDFTADGKQYY
jgi:hypothetical protein